MRFGGKSTEPWYWGYAFQGAVILGLAPILLPLIVGNAMGASQAGYVVAAFYVGQLLAPWIGSMTDRFGIHRTVYAAGYVLIAVGIGCFVMTDLLLPWILLAFIQGAGAASTNTVAAMFIVEFKPKAEWDGRIGWLQTFYGAGQAIGLGLAALVQSHALFAGLLAAGLMLPGLVFGLRKLPRQKVKHDPDHPKSVSSSRAQVAAPRTPFTFLGHYHRPSLQSLKTVLRPWLSPFGLYIVTWFMVMFGTWLIYNLYPLLMQQTYGIGAGLSSLYYAVAATIGVFFYAPSGTWGRRIGDANVLMLGIIMTLISAGGMAALAYFPTPWNVWLVPVIFLLMPVAWSPLIVAGTALTANLTTVKEGEAMGIFNATTAIASVLSALAAGWIADAAGYKAVTAVAAVFALVGLVLALPLLRKPSSS